METKCVHMPKPGDLQLVSRNLSLQEDEVLVKTVQSSICDADLRAWKGLFIPSDLPPTCFPWMGHEGGGVVVEVGSKVREFQVGDQVMVFGPDNSISTYFKSKVQHLHKVPEGLDMKLACLGEPICVGMYGVYQSGVELGDTVVVAGLNFQGQMAVEGLKKKGAETLIALDYSDAHLELAKQRGADIVINTQKEDAKEAILDLTKGKGVDVAYHSCGYWNPHAESYFDLCLDVTRDEGIFVSIPDIMAPINVNVHRFHHHSIQARFPAFMHRGPEFRMRWISRLMNPVAKGMIDIDSLITGSYPLSQIEEAMRDFNENLDHIKILVIPD
ncbi:zinc-binding dehydrogenase [Ammoniphilus sp. YIM 78166]|uniref:zinc-dependent alcohol dehydrogenase n=1 Tax=Ammoniphilus sp. YIM 78166 TaxID=1644106 RepID=UPI00107040AF|nr:zinc-binding dehydrogenase [Ammoniphilus sp. YIM 78166]